MDNSFIGLEIDANISRARIRERAAAAGFDVLNMFSGTLLHNVGVKVHLMQVEGYADDESDQVSKLREALGDECYYCHGIGGYPVIPDIQKNASVQDDAA